MVLDTVLHTYYSALAIDPFLGPKEKAKAKAKEKEEANAEAKSHHEEDVSPRKDNSKGNIIDLFDNNKVY